MAGLPVVIAAGSLAAQTPEQVQTAAQDAIHRLDLQTEMPRVPEPPSFHLDLPPEVLWFVIAIAAAVMLYAFRDLIPIWRSGADGAWAQQEGAGDVSATGSPAMILEAADELAAAGRFVEAMHVLLLHGLAHIRARLGELSDSLTSREILRSTNLPEAARSSLRDVVARVELTYFGQQPAGAADYAACRESFNALERALYGGARA